MPKGRSRKLPVLDLAPSFEDLESGEPERVERAQLHWQPGSYRCSVPEIDHMVDLALRVEGVVGAQLAGAGLGLHDGPRAQRRRLAPARGPDRGVLQTVRSAASSPAVRANRGE